MKVQSLRVAAVVVVLAFLLAPSAVRPTAAQPPAAASACVTPPEGLVSWWPAESSADDIWGSNHGTLANGATYGAGQVGLAFQFDGLDDYITVPDSDSLDLAGYTFEGWLYSFTFPTEFRTVVSKGPYFGENYVLFLYTHGSDDGYLHHVAHIDGNRHGVDTPPHSVPFNTWVHVAGTYDGSALKTYVDGQVESIFTITGQATPNGSALRIGHREGDVWPSYFYGYIDEMAVYNRALSAREIRAIYNAGTAGKCKPPIFVASIDPFSRSVGSQYLVGTTVMIQDTQGLPIAGARVGLEVAYPDGDTIIVLPRTNANGQAAYSFLTSELGTYTFTVVGVRKDGRTYDETLNVETSDSVTVP